MVSGTAALKQGWRLLDPDVEHLEFEDGPIRGPIQFHGMREGARDYSPLEIWDKLFPDSFLDELLNFYSSADEKFKYPSGAPIVLSKSRILQYYAHRLWITVNASALTRGQETMLDTSTTLQDEWVAASQFFTENDAAPSKCGVTILKNLHANFLIPCDLENMINRYLVQLIEPGTVDYLTLDESAPGGFHEGPWMRYEPNKPNSVSAWYNTAALPTSIPKREFCIRVRSFRPDKIHGIMDEPQGMAEETCLTMLQLNGGLLCMDSLYSTPGMVTQLPRFSQLNQQCKFINSIHSGWFSAILKQIPAHLFKAAGEHATLIRSIEKPEPELQPTFREAIASTVPAATVSVPAAAVSVPAAAAVSVSAGTTMHIRQGRRRIDPALAGASESRFMREIANTGKRTSHSAPKMSSSSDEISSDDSTPPVQKRTKRRVNSQKRGS